MTTAQLLWFLVANAGILAANGFLARESFRAMNQAQDAAIVASCHARETTERDGT